jgi:hypothetical protein
VVVIMNSARRIARSLLVLTVTLVCFAAPPQRSESVPTPPTAPAAIDPMTAAPEGEALGAIRPEGRLRKLHLVRPDLIPYPIAYEVYC